MKIAFYRGSLSSVHGVYNRLVRWWDRGPYSHCEIIFSDGKSASSSLADGGVRFKDIVYNPAKWDFFEIPDSYEPGARAWFDAHEGEKYNVTGNIRFAIGFLVPAGNQWFCSEAILASMGIVEPWRISPNGLAAILRCSELLKKDGLL